MSVDLEFMRSWSEALKEPEEGEDADRAKTDRLLGIAMGQLVSEVETLRARLAVVTIQRDALKDGTPTWSFKAPEPHSAEWYRIQADTLSHALDKADARIAALEGKG